MDSVLRRVISISAVVVLLVLMVVASPILFAGAIVYDVATGRRDLPTARIGLFAIVFLAHEWVVVPYSLWLWIRGGFGRHLDLERHTRVQGRWIGSLLKWAERLLGVRVKWPIDDPLPSGTVIVIGRHASMVDAVLPAHYFANRLDRPIHYVLKRELRWLPSIDIYGHRLSNHFVARGGDTDSEVAAIARLAQRAEPGSGIVIFPEGTYSTAVSRERVLASLQRRGDSELVAYARSLEVLLPPKPAGTLALLDAAPDADVVLFGHVGMEGVAEFSGLRRNLPARHPVEVQWWVHPRSEIPGHDLGEGTESARVRWLQDQWRSLDRWVSDHRTLRDQT